MNDELREKLSAYLDGALPAAEASALEREIARSPELLRELEDLQAVSKLVKDLPKEPLPVGFMQRLERRRQGGDAPAERRDWIFISPTYRPYAAALSGLIVAVAVWDKVGERAPIELPYDGVAVKTAAEAPPAQFDLAAKISAGKSAPADAAVEGAAAPTMYPPAVPLSDDERQAAIVARRERVRAPGAPLTTGSDDGVAMDSAFGGVGAGAPAAAMPALAEKDVMRPAASVAAVRGAASPAPKEALSKGVARPQSEEERSALNEEMYQAFEREKKKMGIAALVARDETSEQARRVLSAAGRNKGEARISAAKPALLAAPRALPGGPPALRTDAAYQAAWSSLMLPGQPPPVDFTTEMIVLLPEPGTVDSAVESAGELVVRWTAAPGSPRDRLRPVPASLYPIRLMRQ